MQITGGSILNNRADTRGNDFYQAQGAAMNSNLSNDVWYRQWSWSRHRIAAAPDLYDGSSSNRWYNETLNEYTDQVLDNTEAVAALYAARKRPPRPSGH